MDPFFKASNNASQIPYKCRSELMAKAQKTHNKGTKAFKLFALYKKLKPD